MEKQTCTAEEVKAIIHEELLKERGAFVGKFWTAIVAMGIATASAWFSLYYQVQNIQSNNEQDNANIQRELDSLEADYKSDVLEIKEDIRYIRDKLTK